MYRLVILVPGRLSFLLASALTERCWMVQAESPATSEGEEDETGGAMPLYSAEATREGRTDRGEVEEETDEVVTLTVGVSDVVFSRSGAGSKRSLGMLLA